LAQAMRFARALAFGAATGAGSHVQFARFARAILADKLL